MKLNYTIEKFREQLKKAIYESSINSNVQDAIINSLAKRGYNLGIISGVFEGKRHTRHIVNDGCRGFCTRDI